MSPPKRSRRRLIFWYLTGAVALVLVFLTGARLLVRYHGQRELEAALAETDQLDPKWRLEDLEASRGPESDPEQNGFRQVEAIVWDASSFTPPIPTPAQDARDRFGLSLLSKDQAELLRPGINRAKTKLGLARGVTAIPPGRGDSVVPTDGEMYVNSRPILGFLDLAKGLCADARLRIFDGDTAGAFQDCLTVIHIGGTLGNEPAVMAQLVRNVINLRACDLVEQLLSTGKCRASQLAELQSLLEAELAAPRIVLGIRGERAHLDWMLEHVQSGEISKSKVEEMFLATLAPGQGVFAWAMQHCRSIFLVSNLPGQRASRLRAANELISVGQLPPAERFRELRQLSEKYECSSEDVWLAGYCSAGQNP